MNDRFQNDLWGPGSARLDWDTFGLGSGVDDCWRLLWVLTVESGAFAGTGLLPAPMLSAMHIVTGYDVAREWFPSNRVLPAAALTLAVAFLGATRLVATSGIRRGPERYPVSVAFGREPPATFLYRHLDEMPANAAMQASAAVGNVLSLGMPHGLSSEPAVW